VLYVGVPPYVLACLSECVAPSVNQDRCQFLRNSFPMVLKLVCQSAEVLGQLLSEGLSFDLNAEVALQERHLVQEEADTVRREG